MAINHRRGKIEDFDPNKMTTAEWAFPDDGTARYCVAPGNVKTVATKEELQEILTQSPDAYEALRQLLTDLESNPSELTNILSNISNLQTNKLDKIGDSKDNTVTFTEATTETDIVTGENHATLFGKILKIIKTFRSAIGTLSSLKTTNKTSLVAATNEINDSLANLVTAGTWTPKLQAGTVELASSQRVGKFIKTSNYVRASFITDCSGLNSASGNVVLKGLPFPTGINYAYAESFFYLTANTAVELVNGIVNGSEIILRIKLNGSAMDALKTTNIPLDLTIAGEIGYFI